VVVQFGAITLGGSPVSRLGDADDERRQAKRNSLADKLTVEAKALADLKVEKAAVEGERSTVEADLGPVKYLGTLLGRADEVVLRWLVHSRRGTAAGPGRGLAPAVRYISALPERLRDRRPAKRNGLADKRP
jgi:hypothetical protein